MRPVTLVARQVRYEQLAYWRMPAGLFFTLALPVMLLAIFGALSDGSSLADAGGATFTEFFVPSMAIFGLMNMSYGNVVARIVLRRETGLLQRIRTTPLPAPFVIAGLLGNALVISALLFVVVHAVGAALYGVALPDDWVATVAVLAVGAASFGALAVAVSTFVPNPESADAVVMATLLPVTFVSGGFMPVPDGTLLAAIGDAFPVRHLLQAGLAASGRAPGEDVLGNLAVVAAWGVAGAAVALRRFRWAPAST